MPHPIKDRFAPGQCDRLLGDRARPRNLFAKNNAKIVVPERSKLVKHYGVGDPVIRQETVVEKDENRARLLSSLETTAGVLLTMNLNAQTHRLISQKFSSVFAFPKKFDSFARCIAPSSEQPTRSGLIAPANPVDSGSPPIQMCQLTSVAPVEGANQTEDAP